MQQDIPALLERMRNELLHVQRTQVLPPTMAAVLEQALAQMQASATAALAVEMEANACHSD